MSPEHADKLTALYHEMEKVADLSPQHASMLIDATIGLLRSFHCEQYPISTHINRFIGDQCFHGIIAAEEARRVGTPYRPGGFSMLTINDAEANLSGVFLADCPGISIEGFKHLLNKPNENEFVRLKKEDLINGK